MLPVRVHRWARLSSGYSSQTQVRMATALVVLQNLRLEPSQTLGATTLLRRRAPRYVD